MVRKILKVDFIKAFNQILKTELQNTLTIKEIT